MPRVVLIHASDMNSYYRYKGLTLESPVTESHWI